MASDVKVVISGDSKSLEKAFDNAGKASKDLAKDFDRAEDQSKSFGKAMDRSAEAVDKSEGKFMGAADLLDGLGGAFGLPLEGATQMARAFGDMAGGITSIVAPALSKVAAMLGIQTAATAAQASATTAATGAQVGLNAAMTANPIGAIALAIGALVAVVIVAYKTSETFRDIVEKAFWGVKIVVETVMKAVSGAFSFVKGLFGGGAKEIAENFEVMNARVTRVFDEVKRSFESDAADFKMWRDNVKGTLESMLDPLNKFAANSELTFSKVAENLKNNLHEAEAWTKAVKTLVIRGFDDVAKFFVEMGPQASTALHGAAAATTTELENIRKDINKAGRVTGESYADGITKGFQAAPPDFATLLRTQIERAFPAGTIGNAIALHGGFLGGGIPGRAGGGGVSAGSAYMVGERGPEMFVPGMSGAIVPNGGGGGITINVYGSVVTETQLVNQIHNGLLRKQKLTPLGLAS